MSDLLVKLYDLPEQGCQAPPDVTIKPACVVDRARILGFVRGTFGDGWASECEYALMRSPTACFVAVKNRELVGFACYDATARGFFGPMGVAEGERNGGIGGALLMRTLAAMRDAGYAYAIIGWATAQADYYSKKAGAIIIPDSPPEKSIYKNMISRG